MALRVNDVVRIRGALRKAEAKPVNHDPAFPDIYNAGYLDALKDVLHILSGHSTTTLHAPEFWSD